MFNVREKRKGDGKKRWIDRYTEKKGERERERERAVSYTHLVK